MPWVQYDDVFYSDAVLNVSGDTLELFSRKWVETKRFHRAFLEVEASKANRRGQVTVKLKNGRFGSEVELRMAQEAWQLEVGPFVDAFVAGASGS